MKKMLLHTTDFGRAHVFFSSRVLSRAYDDQQAEK